MQTEDGRYATSLDELSHGAPRSENVFLLEDLVWEHFSLPNPLGEVTTNRNNNPHLRKIADAMGGFEGKRVLELGAYEGYHARDLERLGAADITAIEGNPRNFLKCLAVKNQFRLDRTQYLLGNVERYLDQNADERFDFVVAAGILYHLFDPFAALENINTMTDNLHICTTYYHPELQGFRFTGETREVHLDGMEPLVLHERLNLQRTRGMKHGMDAAEWMFDLDTLLYYLDSRGFSTTVYDRVEQAEPHHVRAQMFSTRTARS